MAKPVADLVVSGASEIITCAQAGNDPLGRLARGSLAAAGGKIIALGSARQVAEAVDTSRARVIDAAGSVVAPGFVDCHTHLVFGGSRAREYAARLVHSAEEVAAMGIPSGITATVQMTRAAGEAELHTGALGRLQRMLRQGTTTVESKSGYGLSRDQELRLLQINRRLAVDGLCQVVSTFMGAHDFPPELSRRDYLDLLIWELVPQVAREGWAEFCDIYTDEGYYTVAETRELWQAAQEAGLGLKVHADAYSATTVCDLAAEMGAVSAEHLNYTTPDQMGKLARAGVVGVVLPALDFAVNHHRPSDARAMREAGMTLALASNLCPACWVESMFFVMRLACRRHAMSVEEALLASTSGAARAVGRQDTLGSLEIGKMADLQIWRLPTLEEVIYRLDCNPISYVVKSGEIKHREETSPL